MTARFLDAVAFAWEVHAGQLRKGTNIPYAAHLLAVASLVMEQVADEDIVIAALLHDAGEDAGGHERLAEIRARFGDAVADTVAACSDTLENPKPPWRGRKEAFLKGIPQLPPAARLISQADLLHNARSILADLRATGPVLWVRFRGGLDGTLWYYRSAIAAHSSAGDSPLLAELRFVFGEIERLAD